MSECDWLRCEEEATVGFEGFDGEERAWCEECYERPCSRCFEEYEDDANKAKGLCRRCQAEIRSWSSKSTTSSGETASGPRTQASLGEIATEGGTHVE